MTDPLRKGDLCVVAGPPWTFAICTYELTEAERAKLRLRSRHQGLDDAGEPRLVPRYCDVTLAVGELLIVERARCRHPRGREGRHLQALSPKLGRSLWLRRMDVQPLPAAADKKERKG